MPSVIQNMTQIRYLLDEPAQGSPSDRLLFELLGNQILNHQSQLQNSSAQWAVAEWTLTAVANVEDYLVTATDFGKPFLCYYDDPTDTYAPRLEVPFSMLQNANTALWGPKTAMITADNVPSAYTMSFYRSAESYYVRITPIPNGTCTYKVWYEVAPNAPQSVGDTIGLTSFHHLIRAQTALAALSYCKWGAISNDAEDQKKAAAWERKVKALAAALGMQASQFQAQFSTYLGTLMQAGVEARSGFGDGYDADAGGGLGFFGPNQY